MQLGWDLAGSRAWIQPGQCIWGHADTETQALFAMNSHRQGREIQTTHRADVFLELHTEERSGVRAAMGFGGVGEGGVASEVYREQETFQLGQKHEKLCQEERRPAEQSGGSSCGLGATVPRGDPAPQTPQGLFSWHQSHQGLGVSSCNAKGPQWGLGPAGCQGGAGREVGPWVPPPPPLRL